MPVASLAVAVGLSLYLATVAVLAARYGKLVRSLRGEPVLKRPVLIVESDDWGPGPREDAETLGQIVEILSRYLDQDGNHPVMTIGVVLAVPDRQRIRSSGLAQYHRRTLAEPEFQGIREALARGVAKGVFALQLHGMEHCWPASLIASAREQASVRRWFDEGGFPDPTKLPPPLQSRWIEGSTVPSRDHRPEETEAAAREEVEGFRLLFGEIPRVVVPPTFIWTKEVERVWAREGVRFVVTPGRRFHRRDEMGRPAGSREVTVNGQEGISGCTYMVRDIYFEPARGHLPSRALDDLERKTREGRPALFETHRFNFVGGSEVGQRSLEALELLMQGALARFPALCFLSTSALGEALEEKEPRLVETAWLPRADAFLHRFWAFAGLRRSAWVTGIIIPAWLFFIAVRFLNRRRR